MVKSIKRVGLICVALMLCISSMLIVSASGGETIVDDLANPNFFHEYTETAVFDTSNAEYLGDPERVVRTDAKACYIVYKMDNIDTFEVSSICFTDPFQDINIYGSKDGQTWNQITDYTTEDVPNTDGFYTTRTYKSNTLSENINFIKFEIPEGPFLDADGNEANWVPQLAKVVLTQKDGQVVPVEEGNPQTSATGVTFFTITALVSGSGAMILRKKNKK